MNQGNEVDKQSQEVATSDPASQPSQGLITTGDGPVIEAVQIAPLSDLKDLFNEIKRNMDKNLELAASLQNFKNIIGSLNTRHIEQEKAAVDELKEELGEEKATIEDPQTKFLYDELIPGTASRLVKHAKTTNANFTKLVGDTIKSLVDLLTTELRLQTSTCCRLVQACKPLFDMAQVFFFHHHQKVLAPVQSTQATAAAMGARQQLKADLSNFSQEEIEWRSALLETDCIDVVKHDLGLSVESWARGEITDIYGVGEKNLGDENGDNVKKFSVKYEKDAVAGSKIFRADSPNIAPYDSKTQGNEWRHTLQVGDEVDVLDNYGEWSTVTVIKKEGELDNPLPMIMAGFRRYNEAGDQSDAMGMYFGKGVNFDLNLGLYSVRVQKPFSIANNADPDHNVVWSFKAQIIQPVSSSNISVPGGNPPIGGSQMISTTATTVAPGVTKTQDQKDMEMITEEIPRIFATERYSCKSSFLVETINQFGEAGGYESLLTLVSKPEISLEYVYHLVSFFVKSHSLYHRQFVDDFYDRLRNTVEAKLLGVTGAHLRATKLSRIEEIITLIWQTLLLRRMTYLDLQVLKSKLQVKVGILFMKQTFLEKRIDGAKMIDSVCKKAISEVGGSTITVSAAQTTKMNLLQELVDTLREANVLDLFFSSKNIHSQLVQRSDGVLKLMLKKQALSEAQLELIWVNCQSHESMALDLSIVLQNISYAMEVNEIVFFSAKILAKSPATVKAKEVDLMMAMGRRTSITDEALKQNQERVVQFFWNYLFDGAAMEYLDISLATNALNSLAELLRLTNIQLIRDYFAQLIDKIRAQDRSYFGLLIASRFIKLFVSKDDVTRDMLLAQLQTEHDLVDLLIQELEGYMTKVQTQVTISENDKSEIGKRVFCDLYPHSDQLSERMAFIKEYATSGSFQLSQMQISRIWTNVIVQNPILEDHKIVSVWLKTVCDDFMLGRDTSMIKYDDLLNFFKETICTESNSFSQLTLEGYHCIQGFFLLINLRADKLVVQDDDVARVAAKAEIKKWEEMSIKQKNIDPDLIQVCVKVAPNEMEGIQVLWKIAIDCHEAKVGTGVTSMLLQVHTNVDFGLEQKITSFEDQFIDSCMSIIKKEKKIIDSRSPEELKTLNESYEQVYKGIATKAKINKVLPVQEKRIVACLSYLKMLVGNSERDGMNDLIPHTALQTGTVLGNITINNAYEKMNLNGFRNRFSVQMFSNATVYQLKQRICQELSWQQGQDNTWAQVPIPHPWTIKLSKFAGQTTIRDNDNGKTLSELGFKSNDVLSIFKKGTQSVSKMPLITTGNEINERAKYLFTQIFERYAIEHPEDADKKVMMRTQMILYVQHATGVAEVSSGVDSIMLYARNEVGKMHLEDFLCFYQDSVTSKLTTVRSNLANMGYRDDLQIMPLPGSQDNILQARKTVHEMPRFKISQNIDSFGSIVNLLELQTEVSKEAQSLIQMICTNQKIFWNVLKLSERTDEEGPFSWDMIFNEDIKVTMYSLEIIDSIVKTHACELNYTLENSLRLNWVERFLSEGGFGQLLTQLKRALSLAKESLVTLDYSSETNNLTKKFIDQMLRLMKTFIFAAIYADQEPTQQEGFLQLKRQSSKIQEKSEAEKAQEAEIAKKQEREKVRSEMDEAQLETVKSSVGGPTMPYNPPYSTAVQQYTSSGERVYGPMPAGHTIVVDNDLERALKESEDPQSQIVPGASSMGELAATNDEFEQTPRFKQIVDQIRNSQFTSSLIKDINFNELQEKLLDTLAIFLANKNNSSKEEGNIISSALSLWSAAIVQKNELIIDFFNWSREDSQGAEAQINNTQDFILNGIYSPKSLFVRNQFRESIELICEKVIINHGEGERPLFYIINVLMNHFPSPQSRIGTRCCGEYFELFGALIKQYQELVDKHPEEASVGTISVFDLLKESFTRLREHESTERDSDSSADETLIGLLILVKELLDCYIKKTEYEQLIEFSKKNHLLHEFYYENLYYMPERTTNAQNKCKTLKSRTNAYKLLYKLMKAFKPKEMGEFLEDYLWPMIKELSRPTAWRHQPSDKQRSAVHKQAGINNLGNICYMISMLQQLFMVPQFRYQVLKAVDDSAEDIQTYKERKVDDSLLRQFQRLFGFLELSERASADPFDLCFAYKDLTGEPTNVGVQCDSQEFLTFFFDKMEDVFRGTSQKYLLQDVFRGTYVEQKVCQGCGKTKNDLTTGYTLSVQVENTKDLYASLSKVISGEVIEDFTCDGCNQKVNLTKRQLLGSMPNVLIVHLQRIVFDYNTFGNKKVNSKFEFPKILELNRFSFKEEMSGNAQGFKGETDAATAELGKLMETEDEDYVYRLVGVNIHRGVADSGHYWSMINTKRGKDEPDPTQNNAEWRSSNQADWKKFDDESVSSYNLADLEKDSHGGDTSSLTQDEQYISNTAGGSWGKSAYMLIYEKKLKKPIREVDLSAKVTQEEEKVDQVAYRDVTPQIPDWVRQMVQKDNTEFVIDRQVFNTQFFKLVMLVLKHISADLSMTSHQYPLDYQPYFNKMNQVALKIGHKVMFDFLSHYHENACLSSINDYMSTIFTFSDNWVSYVRKAEEPSIICDWIQTTLLDDQCTYFFHLMFNCPDKTARLYCSKIITSTVNKGFRILSVCESKEDERNHPKVKKLRATLDGFMKLAFQVIHTRDCQKNWTRLEQFYQMLEDISTGGQPQAEYLLGENGDRIVVDLIDLMLQDKSPKVKDEAEPRVEMGGSVSKMNFSSLVNIVCHLVRCMHTQTISETDDVKTFKTFENYMDKSIPSTRVSQKVQLSDETMEFLTNKDFITLMTNSSNQETEQVADALAHICYANKKITKQICRIALNAINVSDYGRISGFLKVVESQLKNDDMDSKTGQSLLQRRLEWIFGYPFLNTGLQQGETHKIGLESLHHDIKGEVYTFKSMLTHDPDNNSSLLHLLWRYQGRMEDYTMTCLNCLADIVTGSEKAMDFFSQLPGVTYQYARYSDWIQPFLTSQLNKVSASTAVYSATSKEDIVKIQSKFEIYDSYIQKKDTDQEAVTSQDEENKDGSEIIDTSDQKFMIKTLKCTPPAYIICKCTDENYLNVIEHDGVMLSQSYFKGSYVMSRPTGYTNLAISATFLASGSSKSKVWNTSTQGKSASAMLAQLEAQKSDGGFSGQGDSSYAQSGTSALRVKQCPSASAPQDQDSSSTKDPPKIIVDNNDEWDAVRTDAVDQQVQDYTTSVESTSQTVSAQCCNDSVVVQVSDSLQTANTNPQEEESKKPEKSDEILNESFDNWTGDEMHSYDDLVYKLTLSNTTESPILFKISFKELEAGANLNYPINGIKGSLAANEMSSVAALLTRKISSSQNDDQGKFELEKVQVSLNWKHDAEKIARMAPYASSSAVPATSSTATQPQNDGYQDDGYQDWNGIEDTGAVAASSSSEKQCSACTTFNPKTATQCWICETTF